MVNPTNGRYFPLCCGAWNGCGAADHRVQQSALPESNPCEYGDGVSGAVDISWRGDKAGDCEKSDSEEEKELGMGIEWNPEMEEEKESLGTRIERNPDPEEEKEPGTGIERNSEPEEKADSGNWQKQLHELGFHTVAMALKEDSLSIDDPKLMNEDKLAIVLGTEGDGLAPETIATCDDTVCIPMAHGVDSFVVAPASAVAFWQLGRQAHKDNCCNMNSNYQLWE